MYLTNFYFNKHQQTKSCAREKHNLQNSIALQGWANFLDREPQSEVEFACGPHYNVQKKALHFKSVSDFLIFVFKM